MSSCSRRPLRNENKCPGLRQCTRSAPWKIIVEMPSQMKSRQLRLWMVLLHLNNGTTFIWEKGRDGRKSEKWGKSGGMGKKLKWENERRNGKKEIENMEKREMEKIDMEKREIAGRHATSTVKRPPPHTSDCDHLHNHANRARKSWRSDVPIILPRLGRHSGGSRSIPTAHPCGLRSGGCG